MEAFIQKLKKFRVLIIIAILIISGLLIWLVLRSSDSSEKETKGEAETISRTGYFTDTAYPVYISDRDGSLVVELDGSKSSDLKWETDVNAENNLWIKDDGEEYGGKLTTVISPAMAGYTTVTFTRSGEIMGTKYIAAKIQIDVIGVKKGDGIFTAKLSDIRQITSDTGAVDTESPYIISGCNVLFPKSGDWTLTPENEDKLPAGLYTITRGIDTGSNTLSYSVSFNPDVIANEEGTVSPEALNSVLVLKSESLGIEKKLACVMDSSREWRLTSVEEQKNAE